MELSPDAQRSFFNFIKLIYKVSGELSMKKMEEKKDLQ